MIWWSTCVKTNIRGDLGHHPRVTLEVGVPRTFEWMKSTYQSTAMAPAFHVAAN